MPEAIADLKARLGTIMDLSYAAGLLGWDQRTHMPPGGAAGRAEQLATLRRLSHELATDPEIGRLLDDLAPVAAGSVDDDDAALVRLVRRDYDKQRKLPAEFVSEWARARALSQSVWEEARRRSDWAMFRPHLEQQFEYARRQAEYLGYDEHPYDALLDLYEPGMKTAQVRALFRELKEGTVPLLRRVVDSGVVVDDTILHQPFDEAKQEAFGIETARLFGYDWQRGRQDRTVHPFASSFGPNDARITTRFYPDFLNAALFGTMHESGHAMYEQGVDIKYFRTPLCRGASLGVHESQSRLWENLVGRSRPFWAANYARLQALFPEQLGNVELEDFYRAVNKVQPSFIRVEADELTYNLHIMLRFELETDVLEGKLKPSDLAEEWMARMEADLGVTPPDDARGVLQDTHWSGGMIGYFPTYTLGNVLSVQLWEAALASRPEISDQIARNEFGGLLGWLRENVHQYGRKYEPNTLIERATGRQLTAQPYLEYLHAKFGEIYGV